MTTTFLSFGKADARRTDPAGEILAPSVTPAAVRKNSRRFHAKFWLSSRGDAELRISSWSNRVGDFMENCESIRTLRRFVRLLYKYSALNLPAHCFALGVSFDEYTNCRISALCLSKSAKCCARSR